MSEEPASSTPSAPMTARKARARSPMPPMTTELSTSARGTHARAGQQHRADHPGAGADARAGGHDAALYHRRRVDHGALPGSAGRSARGAVRRAGRGWPGGRCPADRCRSSSRRSRGRTRRLRRRSPGTRRVRSTHRLPIGTRSTTDGSSTYVARVDQVGRGRAGGRLLDEARHSAALTELDDTERRRVGYRREVQRGGRATVAVERRRASTRRARRSRRR